MIKEYNYVLEKKDLKNFARENMFMKQNVIKNIRPCFIASLIIGLIVALIVLQTGFLTSIITFILVFAGFFIVTILLTFLILFFATVVITTSDENNITFQLDTDSDSFNIINTNISSTKHQWKGIVEIYNKKHNILLYVSKDFAIIIPKRIFDTQEELDEFWNIISDCYKKAKEN